MAYFNQYQPMYQPQMQQPYQPQQIQNGGFVSAPNEAYARNYSVAPGNSVTFKDESAPYVYAKTMGFSQFDRPIFEKYRLVKEEPEETTKPPETLDVAPINKSIENIKEEIELLWAEVEDIRNAAKKNIRHKDDSRGDD